MLKLPKPPQAVASPCRKPPRLREPDPVAAVTLSGGAIEQAFPVPLIGGSGLCLEPSSGFLDPAFTDRWASGRPLIVYLAGCHGLRHLTSRLNRHGLRRHDGDKTAASSMAMGYNVNLYKVGTHTGDDLSERMRRLSTQTYAGLWIDDGTPVLETGFDSWMVEPLVPGSADPSPGCPIRVGVEGIEVTLPATMTATKFDQQLGRSLCTASLAAFSTSVPGRSTLQALGQDHRHFLRYSPDRRRPTRATEIVFIRPKSDLPRLLRLCEAIVLQHVLAGA